MIERYTTAPPNYDGFGTVDQGIVGHDTGRPMRCVCIVPEHLRWQELRYGSGMHRSWTPAEMAEIRRQRWWQEAEADSRV